MTKEKEKRDREKKEKARRKREKRGKEKKELQRLRISSSAMLKAPETTQTSPPGQTEKGENPLRPGNGDLES